jgi:hypothetical protein
MALIKKVPHLILSALIVFLLYWRWQISQTRFFDVDEFSYLHWAGNVAQGQRPYVDFFMFFTPGFLWLFAPLVTLFWMSTELFVAARVVAFGIFMAMVGLVGALFGMTRGWRWALVPMVLLLFLPMPYDKFLEVRPDNLATLLALGALVCQVAGLQMPRMPHAWFWSGVLYVGSLLVFVKTLPFVVVGLVVALFVPTARKLFLLGMLIPTVLFALWLTTLGDWSMVWYSLTALPFEANQVGSLAIMEPHLFFFPNASFYGGSAGITWGLIANHALWILGLTVATIRLMTPFVTAAGDRRKVLVEMLVAGACILSVAGYVQFFPLKHAQYLIPIALFVSYYAADGVVLLLERLHHVAQIAILVVVAYGLAVVTVQVNQVKLSWSNTVQLAQTQQLIEDIPASTRILDIEGRMLFWPDAYHICCVPFGLFERFLSRKPDPLQTVLERDTVPYIFQGDTGRVRMLSFEDQAYIQSTYESVAGWDGRLLRRRIMK